MKKLSTVSIVVPNFNNWRFVRQCIASCLAQTFRNVEVVVVDDKSTDNSVDLIKECYDRDSRVRLICNDKNIGVARTRDVGIRAASSPWICTLDSDDIFYNARKIEGEIKQLELVDFDSSFMPYSGIALIDESSNHFGWQFDINKVKRQKITIDGLLSRSCHIPRDFIFHRDLYFAVGGYDFEVPIYEDWDLKIRLANRAEFVSSGINGIGYRKLGTGLSSAKQHLHWKWKMHVLAKNIELAEQPAVVVDAFYKNLRPSPMNKCKHILLKAARLR